MENKMIKKICPRCGKVIESLYEGQLDYNFKAHRLSCEKKNNIKEVQNQNDIADNKKPVEKDKV